MEDSTIEISPKAVCTCASLISWLLRLIAMSTRVCHAKRPQTDDMNFHRQCGVDFWGKAKVDHYVAIAQSSTP